MVYLYAYTNHKNNLDSLRRIKALYSAFNQANIEVEILLNEYRAQLLAREWGMPLATTIETIKDIDAVATVEDIVIIDSPEDIEGKVLEYGRYFKKVIYIDSSCENKTIDEAINFKVGEDGFIYTNIKNSPTENRNIFIYGDSDYNKTILKNLEIFKDKNFDLYWGNYFFVKYEDKYLKVFNKIIEAEDYYEILQNYSNIVTSSTQIAIEAKANGLNVSFLELEPLDECNKEMLLSENIEVINNLINYNYNKTKENIIINNIDKEIINITKSYM